MVVRKEIDMPLIRKAKGVYALYKGKPKKSIRNSEITGLYINYRDEHGKPVKERVDADTVAEAQLILKQRIVERDRIKDGQRKSLSSRETISTIAAKYFSTRSKNVVKDQASFNRHI